MGILVAIGLLALGFWHAKWKKASEEAEKRLRDAALDAELVQFNEEREKVRANIIAFTAQHEAALRLKERQLVFTDDYGRRNEEGFKRELEYFYEKVVPYELRRRFEEVHGRQALLMAISSIQIFLHECEVSQSLPQKSYRKDMSGVDFERLVAERLESVGADVRLTPNTGDQGADLIVRHQGGTIVVQCKRSASTVGNKAVQEAYAGRKFHDAEHAWVVSDAPFSRQARQLAASLSVRLIDFDQVEAAL